MSNLSIFSTLLVIVTTTLLVLFSDGKIQLCATVNSKIILFNEAFIYSLLNHLQYNLEYDYVKKTLLFTSKGEFREIFSL